jgi:hypothetical protein
MIIIQINIHSELERCHWWCTGHGGQQNNKIKVEQEATAELKLEGLQWASELDWELS